MERLRKLKRERHELVLAHRRQKENDEALREAGVGPAARPPV